MDLAKKAIIHVSKGARKKKTPKNASQKYTARVAGTSASSASSSFAQCATGVWPRGPPAELWILCNCMRELFSLLPAGSGLPREIIASQRDNGLTASSIAFYVHQPFRAKSSRASRCARLPLSTQRSFLFILTFKRPSAFLNLWPIMRLFFLYFYPSNCWRSSSPKVTHCLRSHLNPTPPL